jgi:N4-(beta-N-acetylglucosaminyl)-L-asparaginase
MCLSNLDLNLELAADAGMCLSNFGGGQRCLSSLGGTLRGMDQRMDRRAFLAAGAVAVPGAAALAALREGDGQAAGGEPGGSGRPVAISSLNGLRALETVMAGLRAGTDPLDAVVAGVSTVESDPKDMTVGLGGIPNERGVVELDASVMHGPTHKAGAVAALQRIANPAQVALTVLRRTDHVLLVGQGALDFARAHGFVEQDLLTDEARQAWLRWKANLNPDVDWLDEQQQGDGDNEAVPRHHGTIHCAAMDAHGDLGACTSTSGLSFKIPGRVGDSPLIGAGMFVDNRVGAAGATGRGESVIQSCGAFQVVRHMADGVEPAEACRRVLAWIADHTHRPYLLNDRGEPNFNVVLYALRKDGTFGSACMRGRRRFAVHDGTAARGEECVALYESD